MIQAMDELNAFLGNRGVRFFAAGEVVNLGHRNAGAVITMPPRDIWWHAVPTLRVLDRIREHVGPIRILSGYRNPEYNAAIGGASNSLHTHFNAFDWRPVDWDAWTIEDLVRVVEECAGDTIYNFGGLGVYEDTKPHDGIKTGFIHLDTRSLVMGYPPSHWTGHR